MSVEPFREIDAVTRSLHSVGGAVEEHFLDIGKRLASAIAILETITAVFENLAVDLAGDTLTRATGHLTEAATQVSGMGRAMQAQRTVILSLDGKLAAINGNLAHLRQTMKLVDILAKNGKIQAANIDRSGVDFSVFTKEVDRMVALARASLDGLQQDLARLGQELGAAGRGYEEFDRQQAETIANIPKWLGDSVDVAAAQRQRAADGATMIREKSLQISEKVGAAVLALQIGDMTRQRIQHVEEALDLLRGFLGTAGAGPGDRQEWWRSLNPDERNVVIVEICRLQSAQLGHAAGGFENGVGEIVTALTGLSADAQKLLKLSTGGGDGRRQGRARFLGELEDNVSRALGLLQDFKIARNQSDRVAGTVVDAVMRSAEHIGTVQSLEVDLRILGLNMTLKCGRLGEAGNTLSKIAHELRDCADRTTEDATTVMQGLDDITKVAEQMAGGGQGAKIDDIGIVEKILTESVGNLGGAGQALASALTRLAEDSSAVVAVLDETASRIGFREKICRILRQGATTLDRIADSVGSSAAGAAETPRIKSEILAQFGARYTMASERTIHQMMSSTMSGAPASMAAVSPGAGFDDILF